MNRYQDRPAGVFDRILGKVIHPTDTEWHDYRLYLRNGGAVDPPDPEEEKHPEVRPVPPEPPPPPPEFDFVAAGKARDRRKLEQEAKTNPIVAELLKRGVL